jgi:hypothetical protein
MIVVIIDHRMKKSFDGDFSPDHVVFESDGLPSEKSADQLQPIKGTMTTMRESNDLKKALFLGLTEQVEVFWRWNLTIKHM